MHVAGLPTFLRARPEDGGYQVLVGPYVSTDEAERAQRALALWRLGETRLVVDDSLRGAGPAKRHSFLLDEDPARRVNVMLVAASGTASLVFELPHAPRGVELQQVTATRIDLHVEAFGDARPDGLSAAVGAAPGETSADLPSWTTPESVLLVKQLFVQTDVTERVRARLVVPEGVQSRIDRKSTRLNSSH